MRDSSRRALVFFPDKGVSVSLLLAESIWLMQATRSLAAITISRRTSFVEHVHGTTDQFAPYDW